MSPMTMSLSAANARVKLAMLTRAVMATAAVLLVFIVGPSLFLVTLSRQATDYSARTAGRIGFEGRLSGRSRDQFIGYSGRGLWADVLVRKDSRARMNP